MYRSKENYDYMQTLGRSVAQSINNQLYRNENDYDDYFKLLLAVTTKKEDMKRHRETINRLRFARMTDDIHSYLRMLVMQEYSKAVLTGSIMRVAGIDIEYKIPTINYKWYNWDEIFLDIFKKPPVMGTITGEMGTGKTYSAVWLSESLNKKHIHVASNIDVELINPRCGRDAIHYYHRVTSMSGLMNLNYKNTVVILDETGIHWSRRDNTTRKNKDMEKFIRLFRKRGLSLILIDQLYSTIPNILKEWSSFQMKRYRSKRTVIRSNKLDTSLDELKLNIYKFDTKELPPFKVDIDIQKFLEEDR